MGHNLKYFTLGVELFKGNFFYDFCPALEDKIYAGITGWSYP